MTIHQFRCGCADYAREHWWNGTGAGVILFLIATFIWKRPDNDYLLYAALFVVIAHSYLSTLSFGSDRHNREHIEELAVAYREQLKLQETTSEHPPRIDPFRATYHSNGDAPHRVSRVALRTVAGASR